MHRLALMIALLLASPTAEATVLVELTTRQLTVQSQLVVRGKVVDQRVVAVEGRLWTDSTIQVAQALKGSARRGATLVLRQPGGEIGGVGMRVTGVARFRRGEEVVVFARAAGPVQIPVGMCQGKFEILRDRGGQTRVRRDLTGAGFVRFAPDGRMLLEHRGAPERDRPLGELLAEVRAAAHDSKGGAR